MTEKSPASPAEKIEDFIENFLEEGPKQSLAMKMMVDYFLIAAKTHAQHFGLVSNVEKVQRHQGMGNSGETIQKIDIADVQRLQIQASLKLILDGEGSKEIALQKALLLYRAFEVKSPLLPTASEEYIGVTGKAVTDVVHV